MAQQPAQGSRDAGASRWKSETPGFLLPAVLVSALHERFALCALPSFPSSFSVSHRAAFPDARTQVV